MAEFDPYHKWLAIPPAEQPPNLYRLLALNLFESDSDVIDSAANARMIHLRSLQSGPHGELTQRLLNEIAAARLCLLKPEKKSSYDTTLRSHLASRTAARIPPPLPLPQTSSAEAASIGPAAAESTVLDFISAAYERRDAERRPSGHTGVSTSSRAKKAVWPRLLMILGPLIGIGVVAAAITFRDSHDANQRRTVDQTGSALVPSAQSANDTTAKSSAAPQPAVSLIAPINKAGSPSPAQSASSASDVDAVSGKLLTTREPGSRPSRIPDTNPDSKPVLPPGAAKVRLQYRCMETKPETNQIRFHFQIENEGDTPLPIAELKVRYWYASAADKPRNFWCDYAAIGKDNVAGRFVAFDRPTEHASGYLELTFSAAAFEINPGANSGEIQCRFAVDDWSNFDQSKDFSFDPAETQWGADPHMAVYQRGKLVWGQEPVR